MAEHLVSSPVVIPGNSSISLQIFNISNNICTLNSMACKGNSRLANVGNSIKGIKTTSGPLHCVFPSPETYHLEEAGPCNTSRTL